MKDENIINYEYFSFMSLKYTIVGSKFCLQKHPLLTPTWGGLRYNTQPPALSGVQ